ncbi:hypothetical protein C8Q76DRAFT_820744 [Earliella scabrosa]|nr:hypothetical protein C8Q76DRAFT_820744 [Earliella scabrosa]
MRLSGPLAHRTAETSPIPTASIFHHSTRLEDDRQHFANQLLPIAFKADPDGDDPFDDDPTHPIHLSHDTHRCAILDVITSHIENVCAYQHRTAVFSLVVVGRGFRVLRWAHDGLIVTRTIDYVQDTRMLVEFLLGYLCLEDVRKGIDPSASLLPSESEEYKLMDHLARHGAASATAAPSGSLVFDHIIHLFADSLKDNWPRYRLTVPDERTFLVGKPIAQSGSRVIGRGTRGYVAWHEKPGCFVFLKDTWRPSDDHAEAEGDVLQKLNDAMVVNVPTLVCHGFVGEQEFLAGRSTLHDEPPRLRRYTHYRMCVKEICLPLSAFTSSKQLVSVVRDSIEAHYFAYERCKTIHSDISSGNILINPTIQRIPGSSKYRVVWTGILADWELSKLPADALNGDRARQPKRIGTWSYMSVAALLDLYHATTITDEIESFFNVVLYNAIRYLPHNVDSYVDDFIKSYFTDSRPLKGIRVCSSVKEGFVRGGLLTHAGHNIVFESKPLTAILQQLLTYISARYAILAYEAERQDSQTTELSNAAASPPGEPLTETPDLPEDLTLADFADALPVTYTTRTLQEPTEEIKQNAQRIATHKAVRLLLWSVQHSGL